MNDERLDDIYEYFNNPAWTILAEKYGKELIQALREERSKSAELQKEIDKITILRPIKNIQNNIKTIKKI